MNGTVVSFGILVATAVGGKLFLRAGYLYRRTAMLLAEVSAVAALTSRPGDVQQWTVDCFDGT